MIECENCRKKRFEILFQEKIKLIKKHEDYWRTQRKFWIGQWKDIINKGKIGLEITIENKIMELDDKFGKALDRIYDVNTDAV